MVLVEPALLPPPVPAFAFFRTYLSLAPRKTLVPFYLFVVSVWSLIVYVLLAVAYLVVAVIASGL